MPTWSDFGTEAGLASKKANRNQCTVARMLNSLPLDGRTAVLEALNNKTLTNPSIVSALRNRLGPEAPSAWSVGNHRRGDCRCGG